MKKFFLLTVLISSLFIGCNKAPLPVPLPIDPNPGPTFPTEGTEIIFKNSSTYDVHLDPSELKAIPYGSFTSETYIFIENKGSADINFDISSSATSSVSSNSINANTDKTYTTTELSWTSATGYLKVENTSRTNSTDIKITILANKYEFGGFLHNKTLDHLAKAPNFPNITNSDKYDIITTYISDVNVGTTSISYSTANDILKGYETYVLNYPSELYNSGQISKAVQLEMDKVFSLARTATSLEAFQSAIKTNEISLRSRVDFTDQEKTCLLLFNAVARYSAEYWENAKADENHPWHKEALVNPFAGLDEVVVSQAFRINWGKLLADACGAVVGGVVGGALTGGSGALAGGIAVGGWCSAAVSNN